MQHRIRCSGHGLGPHLARGWTESLDGYAAYAITAAGDTWQTSGFAARIAKD